MDDFILKGDICWSSSPQTLETAENGCLLCLNGKSGGVFGEIPGQYSHLPVKDHSGKLIIPGLTDLHIHAPQFAFRALGMDMELLDWLNSHAFPEEAKYRETEYARKAYSRFVEHIKKGPNTRLCVFATIHSPGTLLLMDLLEESGLVSLVGKVSMNRNCPDFLREEGAANAAREWLEAFFRGRKEGRYKNTYPILTPRFIPSCTDELMKELNKIQAEYKLAVQSHLSENRKEVEWVKELIPGSESYSAAYDSFGLFGGGVPTIMAHCVWLGEKEMDLLADKGVYAAHCPQSNTNLSSGISPVRRFMEKCIPIGLGSDVAGGAHTSIFRAMTDAIQVSKLRHVLSAPQEKALTLEEAFYLGTAGGGSFFALLQNTDFGASGSFEKGIDFDAVIIDDSTLVSTERLGIRDRLERVVYLSDDRHIAGKYVRGVAVL